MVSGPDYYLGGIYYISNNYIANGLKINPCDDHIMHVSFSQNFILDFSDTYFPWIGSNTFATSVDRGLSWSYGPPIEQIIPLGGTISQIINASLGPGLAYRYTKCGKLLAYGQGFDDTHPNRPNLLPETGFLFMSSKNDGKTWTPPKILLTSAVDWWLYAATGPTWWDFYITPDPADPNLLHGNASSAIAPNYLWGNIYYVRSEDGGKTFSPFRQVYCMIDDPVWKAKYFDPNFTSDPNYFIYGGWCLHGANPLVVDKNVLLLPINRFYPKIGSTTYTLTPSNTNTDQAVARSLDNGKTWSNVAGATNPYINSIPHDPGFVNPAAGTFLSTNQLSSPVVSPFTGRVYIFYTAGNPASNPDPDVAQFYPYLLLNASSDQGETWSHAVQINRTPTNIPFGAQQAFSQKMVMTHDGFLVVAYYDLRNWTGFPGEDIATTPLPIDAWLDIYKEVDNPRGGSTGVGLDFIGEIRLTPQSSNARLGLQSLSGYPNGTPEGINLAVNSKNELFVVYSTPNPSSPSNITTGNYRGMTIDTNIYYNIWLQRYQFAKPSNQ